MTATSSLFTLIGWLLQASAKGSVAILLVAVAQWLIGRRVRARWRHALWLVIVLRLVVPVAPSSTWSIFNLVPPHPGIQWQLRGAPGQIVFEPPAHASSPGALPVIGVPWWIAAWKWVAAVWICGALILAARALIATMRTQRAVQRARESAVPALAHQIVEEGRRQLGIARPVRVVESALIEVPALHGVFQPTLLLPEGLSNAFGRDELRHVILHELWHLRRHDIAVNWLLTAVRALHWFNPLVWFAVSRIAEERELACDELTLLSLHEEERFGYGRTILKLLERFRSASAVPAVVGIINHKQRMKRRLMMIGTVRKRSPLTVPVMAALAAICLVAFTDARGVERDVPGTLNPAAVLTLERCNGRVDIDLNNASFSDLLHTIAIKTGMALTQSAAIADSPVQQARFTLHEKNVAAGAALTMALLPFHLAWEPNATGVRITNAPHCVIHHGAGSCRPAAKTLTATTTSNRRGT
ncbi:MAG TPA: M56 family metallopeptidase [Thermoanaerobaculia bacterium]|nr:M56 family metallopeptidase [Thermoanaerobaculia bacterium]